MLKGEDFPDDLKNSIIFAGACMGMMYFLREKLPPQVEADEGEVQFTEEGEGASRKQDSVLSSETDQNSASDIKSEPKRKGD